METRTPPTPPSYQQLPYWHTTVAPIPEPADHPLPERADVVIVGGGYTGCTAALQLARSGARVVLLEANTLGWGASSRNGGIVHPGLQWGRAALQRRFGERLGEELFRDGVQAFFTAERFITEEGFAADYRRCGMGVAAWSANDLGGLEEELAELTSVGLTGRMVRGADVRQELGSSYYPGAMIVEESGMVNPAKYMAGLGGAVLAAGVDAHVRTRVLGVDVAGPERIVRTARGIVRAGAVLIATNGYTDGAVPWVQQRLLPIGSYIIATEPMSESVAASISPRGRVFFDTKAFLFYWHVNAERRLIFGGRASFRSTSMEETARILRTAMLEVHPQAGGLAITHAWGGNVGFTFDRLPHLGEHDGIHYAMGYCGTGVTLGTMFGLRMGRLLGRSTEVADEPLAFERTPFPAAPGWGGVYRGNPWFLPAVGEVFRAGDWWKRNGPRFLGGSR